MRPLVGQGTPQQLHDLVFRSRKGIRLHAACSSPCASICAPCLLACVPTMCLNILLLVHAGGATFLQPISGGILAPLTQAASQQGAGHEGVGGAGRGASHVEGGQEQHWAAHTGWDANGMPSATVAHPPATAQHAQHISGRPTSPRSTSLGQQSGIGGGGQGQGATWQHVPQARPGSPQGKFWCWLSEAQFFEEPIQTSISEAAYGWCLRSQFGVQL